MIKVNTNYVISSSFKNFVFWIKLSFFIQLSTKQYTSKVHPKLYFRSQQQNNILITLYRPRLQFFNKSLNYKTTKIRRKKIFKKNSQEFNRLSQ